MMKTLLVLLLVYVSIGAAIDCDSGEIACANEERCIPHRYICDSDDDCSDDSDEQVNICAAWKNDECSRNEVQCTLNGNTNCIEISRYCSSDNPPCEGDLDRRLCVMLEGGVLGPLESFIVRSEIASGNLNQSLHLAEKFKELLPNTLRHEDCPPMYTLVGDQCLSVFHIGSMSWGESREFCRIIGGDLITFRNVSQYAAIAGHLSQYEMTSNFWVGGRIENISQGWTWVDGSPMPLGSPFWATRYSSSCVERNVTTAESEEVCFHYYQAPEVETKGQCASLSFEQFFFVSDDDCLKKMSPLCVYQGGEKFRKNFFL